MQIKAPIDLRAVLFDFGMVLSTSPIASAHKSLLAISALEADVFDRHYWAHRHAYDEGKFTGESYWQQVASDAGISLSTQKIKDLIAADILMWSGINAPMLEWARSIGRAGFKIGILSNIGFELATAMENNFLWVPEFEYTIWSCRLAMAKPDPKIFHSAQEKLQVEPQTILFIDDREENIRAAQKVGFNGIIFKDICQLARDLETQGFAKVLPAIKI